MSRRLVVASGVLVAVLAVAAYSARQYLLTNALSSNAAIAGVGGKILPGRTYEMREKIRPGMKQQDVVAALGEPTYRYEAKGEGVHGRWVYEYADGKMLVSLADGYATQIDTTFK